MNPLTVTPSGRPRARAFSIPFDGQPGQWNSITDVPGVTVGFRTLVRGEGPLILGKGPVRSGVTAILPRPRQALLTSCFAGFYSANGNGDMSGTHMIEEVGELTLPITITNTNACGIARDATIIWAQRTFPGALNQIWALPVAAETFDGFLNDIYGGHVDADSVAAAIDEAASGPIEEGSIGGGTGMVCFGFKAGSGTASRIVKYGGVVYVVGAFVQANFGIRRNLMVRGRRLGASLVEPALVDNAPLEKSSIIGIVATDAPLLPHQLKRLSRRAPLGVAWTGGLGYHKSGDIFLSFSTAIVEDVGHGGLCNASFIPDAALDPFFDAVVNSVEEAILNSMITSETMIGRDGNVAPGLPHDVLTAEFGRA